jgi:hypothetical protein
MKFSQNKRGPWSRLRIKGWLILGGGIGKLWIESEKWGYFNSKATRLPLG